MLYSMPGAEKIWGKASQVAHSGRFGTRPPQSLLLGLQPPQKPMLAYILVSVLCVLVTQRLKMFTTARSCVGGIDAWDLSSPCLVALFMQKKSEFLWKSGCEISHRHRVWSHSCGCIAVEQILQYIEIEMHWMSRNSDEVTVCDADHYRWV